MRLRRICAEFRSGIMLASCITRSRLRLDIQTVGRTRRLVIRTRLRRKEALWSPQARNVILPLLQLQRLAVQIDLCLDICRTRKRRLRLEKKSWHSVRSPSEQRELVSTSHSK